MAEIIENGEKVEYMHLGEWQKGIIHGARTHEKPNGIVLKVTYLIDTGNSEVEIETENDSFRQPELVEVDQSFVRPLQ